MPPRWDARRTGEGLQVTVDDTALAALLTAVLDEGAGAAAARRARLAAAMKALEEEGWTRETARAAVLSGEAAAGFAGGF